MSEALIALAFGFFVILVVIPLLGLFLFTILDPLWRVDIGVSKLVWLGLILLAPPLGIPIYWLLRPKDFNPWEERRREPSLAHVQNILDQHFPPTSGPYAQPEAQESRARSST